MQKKKKEVFSNQNEWLCVFMKLHIEHIIKYLEETRIS